MLHMKAMATPRTATPFHLTRQLLRQYTHSALTSRPFILPSFCAFTKPCTGPVHSQLRLSSSTSSTRWKARQARDSFSREARVAGLKSRAAFKLLQLSEKHRIFRRGGTVVDLGFAPGSWSQVAANRTAPGGRVIGIDILPAQPPRGVSTILGDFLSPAVQEEVRSYVRDGEKGRVRGGGMADLVEQLATEEHTEEGAAEEVEQEEEKLSKRQRDESMGRVVDVVLSDMSEPWEQTSGMGSASVSNAYHRLMNTSGVPFRDHAGSMDLCNAALRFAFDTLRSGGHFVCKFYQGGEDKLLETRIKRLFDKVHREKPDASRKESREGYFVGLRRKAAPTAEEVFAE